MKQTLEFYRLFLKELSNDFFTENKLYSWLLIGVEIKQLELIIKNYEHENN